MSPLIVGSGSSGSEGRSDRFGLPTGTSDPGTAEAGDMYYNTDTSKIRVSDGTAWADLASGGGGGVTDYTIDNSLRFDSASSADLSRTLSVDGNKKTWTWSGWTKRSKLGIFTSLFGAFFGSSSRYYLLRFADNDALQVFGGDYTTGSSATTNHNITTSSLYRDTSAWYHVVVAYDTTQATEENRVKIYVNGNLVTAFSSASYPAINTETFVNAANSSHHIGDWGENVHYYDGYLSDVHFIDGQALAPTAFGEFDATTGVWNPIAYTGTYPGNSFRLTFANSGSLGSDVSGNNNSWTLNGIDASDQMKDSPTNGAASTGGDPGGSVVGNYATFNPLANRLQNANTTVTLSNGNLDITGAAANSSSCAGTFGVSSGKWYFEYTVVSQAETNDTFGFGIRRDLFTGNFADWEPYFRGTRLRGIDNGFYVAESGGTFSTATPNGAVIGIVFDIDTNYCAVYVNGSIRVSSNSAGLSGYTWFPYVAGDGGGAVTVNFGQKPFIYQAPTGFKSLNTANLPTPTILNGSDYMDAVLYDGNNSTQTIPLSFEPDFMWLKCRNVGRSHRLVDTVRGLQYQLFSDLSDGGQTYHATTYPSSITSVNSSGFVVSNATGLDQYNTTGENYVSWAWDAGDLAAVTNTDGTTQSTVKANVDAGFSIVQATISASNQTLGHGLGRTPAMVIRKKVDGASNWYTSVKVPGLEGYLLLDGTNTFTNQGVGFSSTVFNAAYTGGTETWINYCFAPIDNYSAFGSWQNNGTSDGTFVHLNFRPKLILLKNTNDVERWYIMDSSRHAYNVAPADATKLSADTADAEGVQIANTATIDFLSNGFKIRTTNPNAGEISFGTRTYFYAAFAENPFSIARAR